MIDISAACKAALYKHRAGEFRDGIIAEVSFGILDYAAADDAAYTISPGTVFSDSSGLLGNTSPTVAYATLESGYFLLGSNQRILPEAAPYTAQGYVSAEVSGVDGHFANAVVLEITFGSLHSVAGLTFAFDTVMQTAPEEFTVLAYNGSTLVKAQAVTGNTAADFKLESSFENFNKLRIEFTKTAQPYQRLRLAGLLFGLGYIYRSDGDLISTSLETTGHPLNLSIPTKKLSFSLQNEYGKYSVTGNTSLVRFLKEGQPVTVRYGVYLDAMGTQVEWLKGSTLALETWDVTGINAKFTANGLFKTLTDTTFYRGLFTPDGHGAPDGKGGRSVAELAALVLDDAGVDNYYVNEWRAGIVGTDVPIPVVSHAEALQLLGQMVNATFEEDVDQSMVLRNRTIPDAADWYVTYNPASASSATTVYTNVQSVVLGTAVDIASFEVNGCLLGSSQIIPEEVAPYSPAGFLLHWWPNPSGNYRSDNAYLGIRIDFTQNITGGGLEVDFGITCALDSAVIIANRSGVGEVLRKTVTVKDGKLSIDLMLDNIIWLYVLPNHTPKLQRIKIKSVKIKRTVGLDITGDDLLTTPKETLMPACKEVGAQFNGVWYWSYPYSEELETVNITPGVLTRVDHSDIYYYVSATSDTPGVVFDVAQHYAYCSFIKISGVSAAVNVKFSGAKLAKQSTAYSYAMANVTGTDVALDNPLQKNATHAQAVADFAADYYSRRNQYEIETLAFPQAQVNDLITYKGNEAVVLKHTLSTGGGAAKSKFTLRGN